MKWTTAARKTLGCSGAAVASAAEIRTGAAETVSMFRPACAMEQIEQE